MNIKGLFGSNFQPTVRAVDKVNRTIKSDMAHDRDANGRQESSQRKEDEVPKRPMTPEELEVALTHLMTLAVVTENKWTIELISGAEMKTILVKDNLGTVIRRIPELELWTLNLSDEPNQKGKLLKKAA